MESFSYGFPIANGSHFFLHVRYETTTFIDNAKTSKERHLCLLQKLSIFVLECNIYIIWGHFFSFFCGLPLDKYESIV